MEKPLGIYIHIPFCQSKCAYCDFYSVSNPDLWENYTGALITQIKSFRTAAKPYLVDTVYIGGGTPSILPPSYIESIMAAVKNTFRVTEDAEITIEANPGTLDGEKLAAYRDMGINRLSMGLQSADNRELRKLSRIHTKEEFENSFLLARLEGFQNISVDIMYGLPDQTEEKLSETISYVTSLEPEHISFYGLKVEPNTPFGKDPDLKNKLPDEDTQYRMYLRSAKALETAGFMQYEISNFAKLGEESRHNMKYWTGDEFLGFGPAAYSFFDGQLFSYCRDIHRFIMMAESSDALIDEFSMPTEKELATQYVMLGFRLRRGIHTEIYEEKFHDDFENRYLVAMQPFLDRKYIIKTKDGYRLSRKGMLISNYILSEILEFE